MYKRIIISFLLLLMIFFVLPVNAGESSGEAGYQFLRTYSGARPSAMAGAFISFSGDIHSVYFNPAGLAEMNGRVASATYLNHILDFQSGFIAYAMPLKNLGNMAVSLNYMNYGELDETDSQGNELGTFSAGSFYLTSALSRKLNDNLMVGGSVKFIHSSIATYNSSAVAMDLGLIYHVPFIEDFTVGLGVFNLGTALSAFVDTKDPLPLNFVFGFSKPLEHLPLEYCVSINKYIDDDVQVNVGGEFTISKEIYLRLGYNSLGRNQKIGGGGDQFAGVSAGFGFEWQKYYLDYSLSSYGAIGYLNRLSFSYKF
ncbi:PorV/PorQ family protein [candidate division KSB1 bacterium]|nr:PorV/PorQ family protein [candidate division KSB1 bacterium]MBL7094004.1 PorV/PorQ family protein [candidate division KSB1 bacterium]